MKIINLLILLLFDWKLLFLRYDIYVHVHVVSLANFEIKYDNQTSHNVPYKCIKIPSERF
jgi:hypothetical protein